MSFLSMDQFKPNHIISVSFSHLIRINIGIYDRIVIYGGDMPPPARGCPTRGRAGVTGIYYYSILLLNNLNNKVILLALLSQDIFTIDKRLLADLSIDVIHLLLVDAYTVCLDHLAALSLGWEH